MVHVTNDGVLFAKNSDRDANEAQILEWRPARQHDFGDVVECTYISIPQAAQTYATLLSRPWWMFGAEMGANEHGVVVGNEAVFTREPDGAPALLGMDLVRLVLERSASVDEAAEVLISLLEQFGQGGPCSRERPTATYHNSFLLADSNHAIVVETSGAHWASETVSSGARSISNGLTIPAFAAQFSRRAKSAAVSCAVRQQRTQQAAQRSVGPLDMMAALRDHGHRIGPTWSPLYGSMRAPCVRAGGLVTSSQTTSSLVADLRNDPVMWVTGTAAPCTSIFKPTRVSEPVDLGATPTNTCDESSLWWRHEQVHRALSYNFEDNLRSIANERDELERRWTIELPNSSRAFQVAQDTEQRWLESASVQVDHRPRYVRSRWKSLNEQAELAISL